MQVTYYGHSCFSVNVSGKNLLFDPFISPNALASQIDISTIKADIILLSHGHEDHLSDCVKIAKSTGALVISNYEIYLWLNKQGITNAHPMNIGGKYQFEFGAVKMVNAIHSSSFPDGTYAGNPGGYLIESPEGRFYYSGDTALTYDMKLIGESRPVRFAALPIGDNFTMGPEDATRAAEWVGTKKVLGLHYDTFPPIKINKTTARSFFEKSGIELHLPAIGQSIDL
jgi:L-ascorbate metabolism protein UlaG (beta-lactamase superfamily)